MLVPLSGGVLKSGFMNQEINWARISAIALLLISLVLVAKIIQTFAVGSPRPAASGEIADAAPTPAALPDNKFVSEEPVLDEDTELESIITRRNRKRRLAAPKAKITPTSRKGYPKPGAPRAHMAENSAGNDPPFPSNKWLYQHFENQDQ